MALAFVQSFDKHALVSLTLISLIILAAGAVPVTAPVEMGGEGCRGLLLHVHHQ